MVIMYRKEASGMDGLTVVWGLKRSPVGQLCKAPFELPQLTYVMHVESQGLGNIPVLLPHKVATGIGHEGEGEYAGVGVGEGDRVAEGEGGREEGEGDSEGEGDREGGGTEAEGAGGRVEGMFPLLGLI